MAEFLDGLAADKFKNMSRNELERAHLKLKNETQDGATSLTTILKRQTEIQRTEFDYDPDDFSLNEIADEVMKTQQYLQDEITEVLTALGGRFGKAAWKHWKADHARTGRMGLDDLTEDEYLDLIGECADVMIFAMNIAVQCGVNGYDLGTAIYKKQEENVERQKTGY